MKSASAAKIAEEQASSPDAAGAACWSWMQRPMFWRPTYLAPSAWHEHIPFAFWIMQAHRPRVVVELGVHYGVSYFAFCQAAGRLGLDASLYGIDTFKGDAHSGTYDGTVYEQVKKHNDSHYAGFSSIVRSTFEDALHHFQNGSIDLLHIDGMHTFDAVRADFDSWSQKLSPRAVVLMHDTNVRERGFGVAKMFQDLCSRYPHFEFIHGHGLGVLGIGKDQSVQMQHLFTLSKNELERHLVRETFASLGRGCAEAFEADKAARNATGWMEQAETRDKQTKFFQQCLEKTKTELDTLNGELAQRNDALHAERERRAHEKGLLEGRLELSDAVRLQLMDELVLPKKGMPGMHCAPEVSGYEAESLRKTCGEVQARNRELQGELADAFAQLEDASQARAELEGLVAELNEQQEQLSLALGRHEQAQHDLSETIVLFQAENSRLERGLAECEEKLAAKSGLAAENEERLSTLEKELSNSEARARHLEAELIRERAVGTRQQAEIGSAEKRIQDLEKESATQVQQVRRETDMQMEGLAAENAGLRRGLEDARVQLNDLRGELDKMAKQQDRSEEIASLNRQHAEQTQKFADELASHKGQLDERFAELAELTKMLEEQQTELQEKKHLASSMENLETGYAQATTEIRELKAEIAAKTGSLEERFREIAMLTQIVQQHETLLASRTEELNLEKERAEHFRDLLEVQTACATPEQSAQLTEPEGVKKTGGRSRARVERLSIKSQITLLDKSELFNKDWYLEQYEDVAESGMTPAEHYVRYGAAEGRQPGPDFDTSWYVTNYPDVAETGVNPAVHYLKYGKKEGRSTYSIKRS